MGKPGQYRLFSHTGWFILNLTDGPIKLLHMMDFAREGDVVVVKIISRFAKNTRDLFDLTDKLKEKQVKFII